MPPPATGSGARSKKNRHPVARTAVRDVEERSAACNLPAMKPAVPAVTASAAAENLVGHALLIGRERRVKRLFHRQKLVEPLRSHDHALTLPLVSLDGCRPLAVRTALPHLGAALLKAL